MKWLFLSLLVFSFSTPGLAEFGWLPKEKSLHLRLGSEYLSTSENFDTDGAKAPLLVAGDFIKISELKIFMETEYAFASAWSAKLRLGFLSNSGTSDTGGGTGTIISGSGLGDILLSLKYRIRPTKPGLVFEALTSFPTYGRSVSASDQLLVGDGSIDLTLFLHTTYSTGKFFLAASPYFLFRTGGYAPRMGANLGAGFRRAPIFIMPFIESTFSLGSNLLFDPSEFVHAPQGAGKSYLRLSGSPSGTNLGLRLGAQVGSDFFLETFFKTSVMGTRTAAFWQGGASLMMRFNFLEVDTRSKVQEIPFDSKPEDVFPEEKNEPKN